MLQRGLGKKLPGDLSARATVDVKHRIHIAWMKFNQHRETLLNRHVSFKLRLKFFDSIISPAILFGLTTVPLSAAQLSKLDVVRRRMLRSIVGWVPFVNGDWHDATPSQVKSMPGRRVAGPFWAQAVHQKKTTFTNRYLQIAVPQAMQKM